MKHVRMLGHPFVLGCYSRVCVIVFVLSLSCSAQQRTAANATKKRVMPNQVASTHTPNKASDQLLPPAFISSSPSSYVCLSLSLRSLLSFCCFSFTHSCLCSLLSFLFIPLPPPLFLIPFFGAQGEILVSTLCTST